MDELHENVDGVGMTSDPRLVCKDGRLLSVHSWRLLLAQIRRLLLVLRSLVVWDNHAQIDDRGRREAAKSSRERLRSTSFDGE